MIKTQKGSVIKRYGYVGKRMGDYLYFHRDYWLCVDALNRDVYENASYDLPSSFDFNIVKYPLTPSSEMKITFLYSPDFDTHDEPYIEEYVIYYMDNWFNKTKKPKHVIPKKKQIYHHKWLFVADDYEGFDVKKSMERSENWLKINGIDYHRIGYRDYWEREVLPLINDLK